jgi:GNAT superfamily N-acetyltransferase
MPDMLVKLYNLNKADSLIEIQKASAVDIRRALPPEKHIVVNWVLREFHEHWASECEVAFSHHPVSCFVAIENEKIIGFACYNVTYKGFFGPEGVTKVARGRGIGKALLFASLHAMAEDGYAYAIIGRASPIEFYSKAVDALVIEGSTPGIYRGMLKE